MAATKVLVVDDSLTMRALISGALERIPNVEVVGLADGAAEAREMTARFHPDVMTLDIEMPVTNGLQYLAEVMSTKPMPVIMFSTRTAAGAEDTVEALRLGAVECFPKPKVAVPAELDKIIAKLGKCIKAAKGASLRASAAQAVVVASDIDWNNRVIAIGGNGASTKALFDTLASFPANCPPTIVVQHLEGDVGSAMAEKLGEAIAPRVVLVADGMPLEQGTIYLAPPGDAHVVVDGYPAGKLRLLARDPVAGARPSISVLFASLAKCAGADGIGLLMTKDGEDGAAGVTALGSANGYSIVMSAAKPGDFELSRKMMTQPVAAVDLARTLLQLCSK